MNSLSVAVKVHPTDLRAVEEVIASLPISVAQTRSSRAALVVISGRQGWTHYASQEVRDGARGVLVVAPVVERTAELNEVTKIHGVPVILAHRWASNSAVALAQSELSGAGGSQLAFADFTAHLDSSARFEHAIHELHLIATKLLGPIDALEYLAPNDDSLVATSHLTGTSTPITLVVMRTPTGPYVFNARLVTAIGGVELQIPDPATAAPATVWSTNGEGLTLRPQRYETSHRSAWLRLIELVRSGGRSDDLDEWSGE